MATFFSDIFNGLINIYDVTLKKNSGNDELQLVIKQLTDEIMQSKDVLPINNTAVELVTYDNCVSAATEPVSIRYTFLFPKLYKYHSFFNDTSYFAQSFDSFEFAVEKYNDTLVIINTVVAGDTQKFIIGQRN